MYRIFCESLNNYIHGFKDGDDVYRMRIARPLLLLANMDEYKKEMAAESEVYKELCDLLVYMGQHLEQYPKMKAFLWTLESREMQGRSFGVSSVVTMDEQVKLVNMLLKLQYWAKPEGGA